MKWILIVVLCFHGRGIDCSRVERSFGLLADEKDRDAVHVHLWNDMDQDENYFPNIFGQGTTSRPSQEDVNSVTMSVLQQLSELPQEQYRKSDRELYGQFYKLNPRKHKNIRPLNSNFHPSIMNYMPNGYKTNVRIQPVSKLPPIVRQSLYGMFNQNQPNYYTNVQRKKRPRRPMPIDSDIIRIAGGKVIANEPKPLKYHTFQLHEALPGQKLLPPTRIPLFKPVPPPIKLVPSLDDDFTVIHLPPYRQLLPPEAPKLHPTTFLPNNTHPYPFQTTDFNANNMYVFNANDAMTPASVQLTAPVTDSYTLSTSTPTMEPSTITNPPITATTTAASYPPTAPSTLHVTYSRPTYPNVVYAVRATTESSNSTQSSAIHMKNNRNAQDEFRIMSISKQRNGNKRGKLNATIRPTFGRRRPMRQKQKQNQKRRPLHGASTIVQINRPPMSLPILTTMATTTTTDPGPKWNHQNETFKTLNGTNYSFKYQTTTPTAEQIPTQDGIVYGRPMEALTVDPPSLQNATIEVNTPYSKQISNRNDEIEHSTDVPENVLMNLNRDIERVLAVTSMPEVPTAMDQDTDDDAIDSDPLLMENLNKNEMMPIASENIFDIGESYTQKRAFADVHTTVNRRSDNAENITTVDVDSNAIDADNTEPLDEDKYYKWYSRYAAHNKRKYGRAIISEHFKKVEIEPNVAWVILPR